MLPAWVTGLGGQQHAHALQPLELSQSLRILQTLHRQGVDDSSTAGMLYRQLSVDQLS